MALGSYIFDGNTETPDSVARRRAIADALLKQAMGYSQPKSVLAAVGQGLGDLGEVLAARRNNSRADQAETAGRASVGDLSALFGGGDGSSDGIAAGTDGGSIAATGAGDISTVANPGELSSAIQATAQKLGIDPADLGTAISYETAGTFDPWKAGPTTQWGQHRGLIQWGEPQRAKYGVTAGMPIAAQMDAVGKYLTDAGVKPGMGLLDIYSAINAGRVGRYNASDAGNGGAPGTVRDKVLQQMGGHRAKALALLKAQMGQPTQVASLDPSAGMAQAYPNTISDGEVAIPPGVSPSQPYTSPLQGSDMDPTGIGGYMQAPTVTPESIQKVSQALQGRQAGMVAPPANPAVQKVAQAMSTRARAAMGILQNPWADESQKAIAGAVLKQEMEQNDPARQLALRKAQIELQQMENPAPDYGFTTVGDNVIRTDKHSGDAIPVYQGQPKTPPAPADVLEYQFYSDQEKAAGRSPLPFGDWQIRGKKAGATSVNVGQSEYGTIPAGYAIKRDPATGALSMEPIPGGPAALEKQANDDKTAAADKQAQLYAGIVTQDIDRALDSIDKANIPATGVSGWITQAIPGTPGYDVAKLIQTVKANAGFDRLQQMRAASPTGGALGAVSDFENALLQATIGNLDQAQSKEQLVFNLKRVKQVYNAILTKGIKPNDPLATEIMGGKASGDQPPAGVDPEAWKFMTPEERALWK